MTNFSYLALGDSYTIGEKVAFDDNFPNKTVKLLTELGYPFYLPKIIAKTGFTTEELIKAIEQSNTIEFYDIVSLLIGVNNQYRGYSLAEFKIEFEQLLQRAIYFADNKPKRVFVLSIPDWGVTPFAEGRNRNQVAVEIDAYNFICASSANEYKTNFINITDMQRVDGARAEFLAADGLHPSAEEYEKWAVKLSYKILNELKV